MTALGASVKTGCTEFRVWAPRCRSVDVIVNGRAVPLRAGTGALFDGHVDGVAAGTRYRYRLEGARVFPDPVSRCQPEGVHGPSEVVDASSFPWTDRNFGGHARGDLLIYELHVGTFTRAGTLEAVVARVPALVDLGVTAVEIMPVAEFPGARGWADGGACPYARQ